MRDREKKNDIEVPSANNKSGKGKNATENSHSSVNEGGKGRRKKGGRMMGMGGEEGGGREEGGGKKEDGWGGART